MFSQFILQCILHTETLSISNISSSFVSETNFPTRDLGFREKESAGTSFHWIVLLNFWKL